jgi:hypothetical protein
MFDDSFAPFPQDFQNDRQPGLLSSLALCPANLICFVPAHSKRRGTDSRTRSFAREFKQRGLHFSS